MLCRSHALCLAQALGFHAKQQQEHSVSQVNFHLQRAQDRRTHEVEIKHKIEDLTLELDLSANEQLTDQNHRHTLVDMDYKVPLQVCGLFSANCRGFFFASSSVNFNQLFDPAAMCH